MAISSEQDPLIRLLHYPGIWQAGRHPSDTVQKGIDTGFAPLNAALPGGGWPADALTEILFHRHGGGELGLIMPAIARLSRGTRRVVWVAPPHIPYPPALAAAQLMLSSMLVIRPQRNRDKLWAAEQALRSGACSAVLLWLESVSSRNLRRLQLAAEQGGSLGVLYRPLSRARQPSPAALRIVVEPMPPSGVKLDIVKCRGGTPFSVQLDPVA